MCLTKVNFSLRFIERPDQRISLDDFKGFLLDSQKVITLGWRACLLGRYFIAPGRISEFKCNCRKYGPQTTTRFRNSCLATWKTPWEKWNSPISTKMRYVHILSSPPLFTYRIFQTRRKSCKRVVLSNDFQCNLLCCHYLWEMTWIGMVLASSTSSHTD